MTLKVPGCRSLARRWHPGNLSSLRNAILVVTCLTWSSLKDGSRVILENSGMRIHSLQPKTIQILGSADLPLKPLSKLLFLRLASRPARAALAVSEQRRA